MTGVLDGIQVLDLSWGIGGPMTGMLLADHGAQVTKIEPPGGDPTRAFSGAQVWHRGKRSAVLDLHDATDRDRLVALASRADVLIESYSPGTTTGLGIDFDTLHAVNPRLVYCSITAYGDTGKHADRPGYDALVAARTGHQWESRGVPGGTLARLAGVPPAFPDLVVPDDCWVAAPRPGPLFSGVPWVSVATCYLATLAISAAFRVRELTGRGQRVSTSLHARGARDDALGMAARRARGDRELPELDQRPARTQGRVPLRGRPLDPPVGPTPRLRHQRRRGRPASSAPRRPPGRARRRRGSGWTSTRCSCCTTTSRSWRPRSPSSRRNRGSRSVPRWVSRSNRCARRRRRCTTRRCWPTAASSRCTTRTSGAVRQVGRVYELHACPTDAPAAPPAVGADTERVCAEADTLRGGTTAASSAPTAPETPASPLAGIRVLDLGPRGRGPVGHDDARRPRGRRDQGQPAARRLLDEHAHRDVLQPRASGASR